MQVLKHQKHNVAHETPFQVATIIPLFRRIKNTIYTSVQKRSSINITNFKNFYTGKRLLYLTEAPEVTPPGLGECFVNPKYINALGLRDAVRRPPLYTNRRPPRPYNPYNNKNNNDKLVIQRRKRNSRKRRSVLQESTVRLFWDFILHTWVYFHYFQQYQTIFYLDI